MKNVLLLASLSILCSIMESNAQPKNSPNDKSNHFLTGSVGYQMSGIKDEDFVHDNYSPMVKFTVGKWFSPLLALEVGYRGFYFNTIENSDRRYYNYFYGNAIFDIKSIILNDYDSNNRFFVKIGSGYFYNLYYSRPNIVASLEFVGLINLKNQLNLQFEASSLLGWDIYQGDDDILPSISLGILYDLD